MNSTAVPLSIYLGNIQIQLVRVLLTPTFIIGNLNNLVNIVAFSQSSLRSHVCSYYFIGASIAHLLYLNMGCSTRMIWGWTGYDLSLISDIFCKIRIYLVITGLTISRYFLCLISIDRWMITSRSAVIRRISSFKTARRLIITGIVVILLLAIHVPFAYILIKNIMCGPSIESNLFVFYTIYNVALSLTPLIILVVFSLLLLCNILHIGRQGIDPVTRTAVTTDGVHRRGRFKKKDIQFIKLALIQVFAYLVFNTLHGYNTIYAVITQRQIKTTNQQAVENFLNGIGLNFHYIYTGVRFLLTKYTSCHSNCFR
ncbi:hypothetical protein I4U23_026754 [Adineta vaga]|nr:hypothetical protein I4U23_026754 [Adineta vaga]